MSDLLDSLCRDLIDEGDALAATVGAADEADLTRATFCPGWTVLHQLSHLEWTDLQLVRALTDPEGFTSDAAAMPRRRVDEGARAGSERGADACVRAWQASRSRVIEAVRQQPDSTRVPWFGPGMSITTAVTARIMETFAHGHDIADAVGATVEPTARLRHVATLAWKARSYSFSVRGLEVPTTELRLEVRGIDGEIWSWGPDSAENRVGADAYDFALLATRRRIRADSSASTTGVDAERWLEVVQAYA
ncbi:TIGR03084 family metal-binding protein [Rhodococcus erythropolis]|uniref:TIGR03084 family protein n=1 Tax=Rhodococcus erythropolis TaxID=1833 RepID=A0A8I0ZKS7_RHOER|nr:TIGR03084 family metal-binding protein [Rhodococcus erythropolis]MBH5141085.1 TIGR03084 family protein [Rhodococcus erythropolis]